MYNNRGSGFMINEERECKPDKTLETENFIINYNEMEEIPSEFLPFNRRVSVKLALFYINKI